MTHELEVEIAGITFSLEVEDGVPVQLGATAEDCEPAEPRTWTLRGAWVEEELPREIACDLASHYSDLIDEKVREAELE